MTITVYGIKNCDTVRKARAWLDEHGVPYVFHDYKQAGISIERLASWTEEFGWGEILNRNGTTFRKLPDSERHDLTREKAIALMLAQPSMIRRPIADLGDRRVIGFKPEIYTAIFATV